LEKVLEVYVSRSFCGKSKRILSRGGAVMRRTRRIQQEPAYRDIGEYGKPVKTDTPRIMKGNRMRVWEKPVERETVYGEGIVCAIDGVEEFEMYWLVNCLMRFPWQKRREHHLIRVDR
jgi:hypothetical protein